MRRRRYLGLAAGAVSALAGCAARAFPGAEPSPTEEPTVDCPAVPDAARTVCPGGDGPVGVEQSRDAVSGDAWSLVVAVTNQAADPVGFSPSAWSLFERVGDRWREVVPDAGVEPWIELAPDEPYVWQLAANDGGFDDADQRVFLDLDSGRYAFVVPFRRAERLAAVARFDVTA